MHIVKGYKVFNPDWTYGDKQYTCPGKFEEDVELSICEQEMHFCKKVANCFNYHDFDPENKVAEVIAYGDVVEEGDKCVTNKLEIVREIPWSELLELINTGKGNAGYGNNGNCNSGDFNSGDHNSGRRNNGNSNSGNCNSGDFNSGDYNSGDFNSGDYNSGNRNNGDYNRGNYNIGDWNNCNLSNGCFNTETSQIFLFNKPSDWTYQDWNCSAARSVLRQIPANNEWIAIIDMTTAEKFDNPSYETTGGYLKTTVSNTSRQEWWDNLDDNEKDAVKSIPILKLSISLDTFFSKFENQEEVFSEPFRRRRPATDNTSSA